MGMTRPGVKRTVGKKKPQAALSYIRVSSRENRDRGGVVRQREAVSRFAVSNSHKIVGGISEVVSGSLPAGSRQGFKKLVAEATKRKIKTILVENARAVARSSHANEDLFEMAKKRGIEIIATDMPALYKHQPNPAEKFVRRIVFAHVELEKDMTVHRLWEGLAVARAEKEANYRRVKRTHGAAAAKRLLSSSSGRVKVNGRKSLLQKMSFDRGGIAKLKALRRRFDNGQITVRGCASELLKVLPWSKAAGGAPRPASLGPGQATRIMNNARVMFGY
ncbi:unnamed protein product [Prorocentrum cordatum]|uniref:Resolvase/invertase-type recombinase catalytic domain-containing protein n=1 Tax=Prorocentrum cordatum TaxID=2364126 RepID=A0ABN9SDU9_9DINO|nr:unnamed protein product [Polarella glacialis]